MGPEKDNWWVYMLRCQDGTLYTGATCDIPRRLAAHNSGKGAKYARGRRPVELVYTQACGTHSQALRREAAVKKLTRPQKWELVREQAGLRYELAPMEGITGLVFRQMHHRYFGGVDRYFTPFLSPGQNGTFNKKELAQVRPEDNQGMEVVPQLLTRRAEDFIWAARELEQMGYRQVNLNLGCPSGTVTAKGKGAGFLADPEGLDRFLDQIFGALEIPISIKTRLGMDSPEEFPRLMDIFQQYPVAELILHPRVRADFYRHPVRMEAFAQAAARCTLPLSYNGNLITAQDCHRLASQYPQVQALMIGRGLIANPALARQAKGGPPASRQELRLFHDGLYEGYSQAFRSRKNAICRMKDVWRCLLCLFEGTEKQAKQLRKAVEPADYEAQVAAIFRDLPLREQTVPDWC